MKIVINEGAPALEVIINCPGLSPKIEQMLASLRTFDDKITAVKDDATYLLGKSDILYFDSVDRMTFAYTADGVYEVAARLYELEDRLKSDGFIRSSKAQVVNIMQIASLLPDLDGRLTATMANGERVIISRKYAKSLKERLKIK